MDYTPETLRKLPYVPRLHEEDIIAHADAWEANIERLEAGIGEYQNAMLKWLDEEKALRKRLEAAEKFIRWLPREAWDVGDGPKLRRAALAKEEK